MREDCFVSYNWFNQNFILFFFFLVEMEFQNFILIIHSCFTFFPLQFKEILSIFSIVYYGGYIDFYPCKGRNHFIGG
jgi:hypothetical protein